MECIISIAEEVDEIVRALCGFLCCKGINMATQQPSYASGISPNSSKDIDDREEQEGNLCRNPHSKIISKIYSSENIDAVEQLQEINNKDVVELLQRKINMIKDGCYVLDATPYSYMDQILNEMITTLTRSDIIMIGLYGSSYKSKDNALKKITRRVERDGQFDVVIMASLVKKNTWWNKSLDVRNIQEKLGNQLGLQLQEKTLEERASCLSEKIMMKQKILIILDDLQGEINLTKIGIPFGNDHKGCRILLVANNKKVLSNTMKIPIVFSMDDYC
ncbi:disease resistance protein RFL1-like isoform X2 [Cajanus cajan]|uniref:disease resistance protein RFL1-like isoform X2 n=1 Tax=Cajanus cajan TaxID=3821 RepID=UPI0010FB6930|nr:disease resistance protein RFL1-like isoform X2 [Cajanus cajan]